MLLLFVRLIVIAVASKVSTPSKYHTMRSKSAPPIKDNIKVVWDNFEFNLDYVPIDKTNAAIKIGRIIYAAFLLVRFPQPGEITAIDQIDRVEKGEILTDDPNLKNILNRSFYFSGEPEPIFSQVLMANKNKLENLFLELEEDLEIDPYCHLSINTFLILVLTCKDKKYVDSLAKFKNIGNFINVLSLALIPDYQPIYKCLVLFIRENLERIDLEVGIWASLLFYSAPTSIAQRLSTIINNTSYDGLNVMILESKFITFLFPDEKSLKEFSILLDPKFRFSFEYLNLKKINKEPKLHLGNIGVDRIFRRHVVVSTKGNKLWLFSGKETFFSSVFISDFNCKKPEKEYRAVFGQFLGLEPKQLVLFIIPDKEEELKESDLKAKFRLTYARHLLARLDSVFLYYCLYHKVGMIETGRLVSTARRSRQFRQSKQFNSVK